MHTTCQNFTANAFNDFLEAFVDKHHNNYIQSYQSLLDQWETAYIEFKSSLRRDYRTNEVNKKLEEVIMKTIAAFANNEWWELLIWVDDDKQILWLSHDYQSLWWTKDEFELHLRNLCNHHFGIPFTTNLSISFYQTNQWEICHIDVEKSYKPQWIEIIDNWQKRARFFVRDGNSSKELQWTELSEYLKRRFE
jgi:predicted HTH transcriptional regulator